METRSAITRRKGRGSEIKTSISLEVLINFPSLPSRFFFVFFLVVNETYRYFDRWKKFLVFLINFSSCFIPSTFYSVPLTLISQLIYHHSFYPFHVINSFFLFPQSAYLHLYFFSLSTIHLCVIFFILCYTLYATVVCISFTIALIKYYSKAKCVYS